MNRCVCALLASAFVASAADSRKSFDRTVIANQLTYRYVVSAPGDWTGNRTWPVILALHGSVERGLDGVSQTRVGLAAEVQKHPERWPAVIVLPQCRPEVDWSAPSMEPQVLAALDASMREFHGDSRRVYLTGFSMGGYGTWSIAASHPERFAALVPIAGGIVWPPPVHIVDETPYARTAEKIVRIPAWVFHGSADRNVLATESREMVKLLRQMKANVRYTEYAGVAHFGAWDLAYDDPELPLWLFKQTLPDKH